MKIDYMRLAESADNSVGAARAYATLAGLYESNEDLKNSQEYRRRAIEDMRKLGDRRTTAELILAGGQPTQTGISASALSKSCAIGTISRSTKSRTLRRISRWWSANIAIF